MSLPTNFTDSTTYFQECMLFLNDYKWIYTSSNTEFLKNEVFNNFPNDWQNYFSAVENSELNRFPELLNNQDLVPASLQVFQNRLQTLKPKVSQEPIPIDSKLRKGMSPKKSHEITQLTKLIENSVEDSSILLDFGAGLGYLSEVLYKANRFKILGLECDLERVELARKRQEDYYRDSKSTVYFETMQITEHSKDDIERIRKIYFVDHAPSCAIIGLHACADLSIAAMKLFLEMESVNKLIIMPCCYHKLQLTDEVHFLNFPLSSSLKSAIRSTDTDIKALNRPFLRLACQQTLSRWRVMTEEDHRKHGAEMFLRAVAECALTDIEFIAKRKGWKNKSTELNYEYLRDQYYLVNSKQGCDEIKWTSDHKERIECVLAKYPNGIQLSEGLTCLQTALQEFFENIVLLDRVCFLQEKALEMKLKVAVEVRKILNDQLSPRCHAFVAQKHGDFV